MYIQRMKWTIKNEQLDSHIQMQNHNKEKNKKTKLQTQWAQEATIIPL